MVRSVAGPRWSLSGVRQDFARKGGRVACSGNGLRVLGGGGATSTRSRCGRGIQSKRWVVERTFSWLTAHRRLARGYEASRARAETMIRWAMIGVLVHRLTRGGPATRLGRRPLVRVLPDEGTVPARTSTAPPGDCPSTRVRQSVVPGACPDDSGDEGRRRAPGR
jgi:hypothetical protein